MVIYSGRRVMSLRPTHRAPLKAHRVEKGKCVESVETHCPAFGVAWRFGQEVSGVSSRPKLTGIVRGKAFLHVLRRRPIGCPDSRKRTL
ncbi:hypothetical protein TNCV_1631251 [Trichonephila clavipes]|nr:hypothetical protein TNCV_1631251 [Trichonephila clavipes]